ncbi:MAG: divalent-cation tolerance protein CutA [Promethearchaeota archaeon]
MGSTRATIFFVTVPDEKVGREIAHTLVGERLVACASIVPGLTSVYRWKGKVEEDSELLLILKTTTEKAGKVVERVPQLHPYDTPECVGFNIEVGLPKYLQWVVDSVADE